MGFQSDQQIIQMVGTEPEVMMRLIASIEECYTADVFTQNQALRLVKTSHNVLCIL